MHSSVTWRRVTFKLKFRLTRGYQAFSGPATAFTTELAEWAKKTNAQHTKSVCWSWSIARAADNGWQHSSIISHQSLIQFKPMQQSAPLRAYVPSQATEEKLNGFGRSFGLARVRCGCHGCSVCSGFCRTPSLLSPAPLIFGCCCVARWLAWSAHVKRNTLGPMTYEFSLAVPST